MRITRFIFSGLAALLAVILLGGCGGSRKPVDVRTQPQTHTSSAGAFVLHNFAIPRPLLRVGLVDTQADSLQVRSQSGLLLLDSDARPVRRQPLRSLTFFIKGYDGSTPGDIYRVQVGSFSKEDSARRLADTLRRTYQIPVVTPYNGQTRTWRVQAGAFSSREGAGTFQARLRGDGISDSLIITEHVPVSHDGALNAVNIDGTLLAAEPSYIIIPQGDGFLSVGGRRYRGAVELRVGEKGTILPINIVSLEDYLKGVVPAEMSSSVYPQIEALKAQALAARTYAVRNLGQYARQGFDICNTPACQVYKGVDVEQAMTSQAVELTRSRIITYEGKPINALFTSTSGGHTEDVENVFEGAPVPYLKGVASRPESGTVRYISGATPGEPIYDQQGKPLNFHMAVLQAMGYPVPDTVESGAVASAAAVSGILQRLATSHGGDVPDVRGPVQKKDALELLATALRWNSLIEDRVHELDVNVVFPGDVDYLNYDEKRTALYFLRFGIISPAADGSLGLDQELTQGGLIALTYRIAQHLGDIELWRGNLISRGDQKLHLEVGRQERACMLSPETSLYQLLDGVYVPVSTLRPVAGDMMRALVRRGVARVVVHEPSTQGLTNDRFSKYHHWDVRYSRADLNARVAEYVNIGAVRDLQILRRGVSGRVAELKIVGERGDAVFKGLRIRWVLGLRDTLFTMLRVYDQKGRQTGWRFIGSGWGHGVGLCQVGSYGMALAGATYDEIIKHFYTSVEIDTWTGAR